MMIRSWEDDSWIYRKWEQILTPCLPQTSWTDIWMKWVPKAPVMTLSSCCTLSREEFCRIYKCLPRHNFYTMHQWVLQQLFFFFASFLHTIINPSFDEGKSSCKRGCWFTSENQLFWTLMFWILSNKEPANQFPSYSSQDNKKQPQPVVPSCKPVAEHYDLHESPCCVCAILTEARWMTTPFP